MYRVCVIAVIAFVVCLFSGAIVAIIEGVKAIISYMIEAAQRRKEEERVKEVIERRRESLWVSYSRSPLER